MLHNFGAAAGLAQRSQAQRSADAKGLPPGPQGTRGTQGKTVEEQQHGPAPVLRGGTVAVVAAVAVVDSGLAQRRSRFDTKSIELDIKVLQARLKTYAQSHERLVGLQVKRFASVKALAA